MSKTRGLKVEDIETLKWLNVSEGYKVPPNKVVAVHAFQMLCPGCVMHGVPQANKLSQIFNSDLVQVLGLHTVFEHHEAMQEPSLRAFLHEFRVRFPVGIDVPQTDDRIPRSMRKFSLQGTPSWLLFNRKGELAAHLFGQVEDLVVASMITQLVYEDALSETPLLK